MSEKKSWFSKLKEGFKKSSTQLATGITDLITKKKLDAQTLEELEELLIQSDMGLPTAQGIIEELSSKRFNQTLSTDEVNDFLSSAIATRMENFAKPLEIEKKLKPHVVLIVGVNGGGKTTTIGKLAHFWNQEGFKVRVAAGDTFRAAAVEQLKVWADRAGVPIVTTKSGGDPAGLAFDALKAAKEEGDDILLIDTAGRLQNKEHLMAELEKITRVLKKIDPDAPHSILLVLDATTGQNAHQQVTLFKQTVPLTGLVMTKLDGTAKGGVLLALTQAHGLPIHAIGVGEGIEDLQPFTAIDYARSLLGMDTSE